MRRYIIRCIIRFITGIIGWYIIITLYTIRCTAKNKKPRSACFGVFSYKRRDSVFFRTITLLL